ncbi:hypothetical protein BSNK01_00230 [Bacillaceae bacterium]
MKTYYGPNRLRLVGKAWQIRAKLRRLARHPLTVKALLDRLIPPSS